MANERMCGVLVRGVSPISKKLFAIQVNSAGMLIIKNLTSHGVSIISPLLGFVQLRSQRALIPNDRVRIMLKDFELCIDIIDYAAHWDMMTSLSPCGRHTATGSRQAFRVSTVWTRGTRVDSSVQGSGGRRYHTSYDGADAQSILPPRLNNGQRSPSRS